MRRRALLIGASALALIGGSLTLRGRSRDPAERAARLSAQHGIRVAFGDPLSFYVPPFRPEDAKVPYVDMVPADATVLNAALDGIEASLAQYPPGFVAKLVKAVFVCGRMTIQGATAGGTYGPAWLLLSAPNDIGDAAVALTCRLGVHHELSSFVFMRGDTAREWAATEPPGWKFPTSTADQIGGDGGAAPPAETGFLSAYGATSSENDFNIYAEKMMTDMAGVVRLAQRLPIVARKAQMVRRSYAQVDARMDGVFVALGMAAS